MSDEITKAIYQRSQIGHRVGFGERPALIVIDFFMGMLRGPLGSNLDAEIAATQRLLAAAREKDLPIVHTTVRYDKGCHDGGVFLKKIPSLRVLEEGTGMSDFDPRVEPHPGEHIIVKKHQSAFFGTNLAALLTHRAVDTLIVTGCSTSGCVRATVFDACAHGYRTIIVREAVGDRSRAAHEANLFDMDAKSGDVVSLDEALAYLGRLGASPAMATPPTAVR